MMQTWYNSTKDAISHAEKERKRKRIDVDKITQEMEEERGINVKKFSIESYESWKEGLMNCAKDRSIFITRPSSENLFSSSSMSSFESTNTSLINKTLLPLSEENECDPSFSAIPLVNASNSLSEEEQKGLTKMEKVSPLIKDNFSGGKVVYGNKKIQNEDEETINYT